MQIDNLIQQEQVLRRVFYTANYNDDTAGILVALKKLEMVLFQERDVHFAMAQSANS